MAATSFTTDSEALKTLKSLHVSHVNTAKLLQRRAKSVQNTHSIESTKTMKPIAEISLEKIPMIPPTHSIQMQRNESSDAGLMGSRQYFLGQSHTESMMMSHYSKPISHASSSMFQNQTGPATMAVQSLDESQIQNQKPMKSSTAFNMDQSYYLLESNTSNIPQEEIIHSDDPFVKFWDNVESLVEKFSTSTPFSFTTPPISSTIQGIQSNQCESQKANMSQSYYMVPSQQLPPRALDKNTISLSSSPSKTLAEYEVENAHLKEAVDMLSKKVAFLEKTAQENSMLKSSIFQFREDVAKQRMQTKQLVRMTMEDYSHLGNIIFFMC